MTDPDRTKQNLRALSDGEARQLAIEVYQVVLDETETFHDGISCLMLAEDDSIYPAGADLAYLMNAILQGIGFDAWKRSYGFVELLRERLGPDHRVFDHIDYAEDYPALRHGSRVKLTRAVERYPDFIAAPGLTGTITSVGRDLDYVSVKLDEPLIGAESYDNEVRWHDAEWADIQEDLVLLDAPEKA